MERYLITASLLNSWQYYFNSEYATYESFLQTLKREWAETTEAQALGNEFEEWAIENYTPTLNGCYQVKAYKSYKNYLLYGRIDCLKAGIIYDYKHTSKYEVGKFFNKPQTSMYLGIIPNANIFKYIIGTDKADKWNEKNLYTETYRRDEVRPIELIVNDFEEWLRAVNLYKVYKENWKCR